MLEFICLIPEVLFTLGQFSSNVMKSFSKQFIMINFILPTFEENDRNFVHGVVFYLQTNLKFLTSNC